MFEYIETLAQRKKLDSFEMFHLDLYINLVELLGRMILDYNLFRHVLNIVGVYFLAILIPIIVISGYDFSQGLNLMNHTVSKLHLNSYDRQTGPHKLFRLTVWLSVYMDLD